MTSVERVSIPQKAILWRFVSFDNYGAPVVSAPVEIDCEWPQGLSEANANDSSKRSAGDEVVVNESLPLHSILWFGSEEELPSGTANPTPLYSITAKRIQPDIKGRAFRYSVTVNLFSNTLPTIQ